MIELVYFAIFYVLCCFIVIWRLIKGPTVPDRVVAGDCVDVLTDVALVLVALYSGRGIISGHSHRHRHTWLPEPGADR